MSDQGRFTKTLAEVPPKCPTKTLTNVTDHYNDAGVGSWSSHNIMGLANYFCGQRHPMKCLWLLRIDNYISK